MTRQLKEGIDFYNDEKGRMILTEHYLKERGYCCECGCKHCPYGYNKKVDPNVPSEFQREEIKNSSNTNDIPEEYQKYLDQADESSKD